MASILYVFGWFAHINGKKGMFPYWANDCIIMLFIDSRLTCKASNCDLNMTNYSLTSMMYTLVAPHPHLVGEVMQKKARLLASLLLATIMCGCIIITLVGIANPDDMSSLEVRVTSAFIVVLGGLYAGTRWGHYQWMVRSYIFLTFCLFIVLPYFVVPTTLPFLLFPILLTNIFFSRSASLAVSFGIILLVFFLNETIGKTNDHYFDFRVYSYFLIMGSALTLVFSQHMHRLEQLRQGVLQRTNEQLRQSELLLEERVKMRTAELEQTQAQLVQQEKLGVLAKLAGSLAHELRNPLGVLSNVIYLLRLHLNTGDEAVKEQLNIAAEHIQQSEQIVAAFMDFAYLHQPILEKAIVSELITAVLDNTPPPEGVSVEVRGATAVAIMVDKEQITQALTNILVNAYQAMPQGGHCLIRYEVLSTTLQIYVCDSGEGIQPDVMPKIFEPLFTTKVHGIGFGLSIAQNLVVLNGGTITVQNNPEQGATFIIQLPCSN